MPLAAGDKLGPYEILALIGAGGMGEVYKALDPRLNREVAIKVSAARFTERFDREARAVAALNHPNVCTLYDVGPNYLVMEYVEGEAPKGPMPLDEALRIANQIAAALEAAHEKNITHRDLKPANIKVRPDGTVKVLDFGLVKQSRDRGGAVAGDPEHSPTLTIGMTEAGMILGTAAYMPPEQARGKPVDRRADIWSFGVVLYEMIAGKRPFEGDDVADILAAVLRHEPDWEQVPPQVRPLLQRCLQKDPAKRLRDIGDRGLLLEEVGQAALQATALSSRPAMGRSLLMAGALAIIALVLGAFSPDGRWLAYASDESGAYQVYVVADYTVKGDSFVAGKPRLWSEKKLADFGLVGVQNHDLAPDGKRIAAIMPAESAEAQPAQNHVVFLMNFFDELRRRAPLAK